MSAASTQRRPVRGALEGDGTRRPCPTPGRDDQAWHALNVGPAEAAPAIIAPGGRH